VNRENVGVTLIDVLDRILDKGIVVDAWIRVCLVGIDLIWVEARVVIASFETYLDHAETLAGSSLVSAPPSAASLHHADKNRKSRPSTRLRALAAKNGSHD